MTGARLATADGALGVLGGTTGGVSGHATADLLVPQVRHKATTMIREMWQAPFAGEGQGSLRSVLRGVGDEIPEGVDCLRKDEQSLFSFYAFPAAHWVHLRTSNPIESTCATVRLRRTKGCGMRVADGDSDDGVGSWR